MRAPLTPTAPAKPHILVRQNEDPHGLANAFETPPNETEEVFSELSFDAGAAKRRRLSHEIVNRSKVDF